MSAPRAFRVRLETPDAVHTIDCGEEEFIWDAAARNGIVLPAICHQGRCLTCAAKLMEGEVDQSKAESYFAQDRAAAYILPCTALPLSNLVLRTHQEWAMRQYRLTVGLPAPYA